MNFNKNNNLPHEIIDIILEELSVGLTLVDHNGNVTYYNNLAAELLGWKNNLENSILKCHNPIIHGKVVKKINMNTTKEWHRVIKISHKFIENTYSPVHIPGKFSGFMIITRDVTERENLYKNTEKQAIKDSLTGIYNRNFFNKTIEELLQKKKSFGAIMIDVNGLKFINDNFGHMAGDEIIIKAAQIITESVRTSDYVFRYGGDEFLVLLDTDNLDTLEFIGNRIRSKNTKPTPKNPLVLNLSVGFSSSLEVPPQEVISLADKRMYEDKEKFYKNEGKFIKKR